MGTSARAQQQHVHNFVANGFSGGFVIENPYVRRNGIARIIIPSQVDTDICLNPGCSFPYGYVTVPGNILITGWTDWGAGGQFGYVDAGGNFALTSDPTQVTAYQPPFDFVGIITITETFYEVWPQYTTDPATGEQILLANDGQMTYTQKMTAWEFTITWTPRNWRPHLDSGLPAYTAEMTPAFDHLGNSMAGIIEFALSSSSEPGHCLNAQRVNGAWDDAGIDDSDLKFPFPDPLGLLVFGQNREWAKTWNDTTNQPRKTLTAQVPVRCLDDGAYGSLTATISETSFGSATARWVGTMIELPMPIPYDMNFNAIADVWEEQQGIYFPLPLGAVTPTMDDDNIPAGDGTRGDGLSVYEEYRGLLVRGAWLDLDPDQKDMFVMNFGAGNENPPEPATIPNAAITDAAGFPGAEMPILWLLNANEGSGYPLRVVNYLNESFHNRDVYAAVVVPGTDLVDPDAYAETWAAIWGEGLPPVNAPIIEVNRNLIEAHANNPARNVNGLPFLGCLTHIIAHELGHTVLWHRNDLGGAGHHDGRDAAGNPVTNFDCHIWQFFEWTRVVLPTDFCPNNPGCIHRWKLNP